MKKLIICISIIFFVTACRNIQTREVESQKNFVRVYDVEPQEKTKVSLGTQISMKGSPDAKEMGKVTFWQHLVNVGIFTGLGDDQLDLMPYKNQIEEIKQISGVDIEYVMLGSWDELDKELEESDDDGVTRIVLFNNSYYESINKEMETGKYIDLQDEMSMLGFYDEMKYEQTVLEAGNINGQQVLVPLLYNLSGMIRGERFYVNGEGSVIAPDPIVGEGLNYEEFIEELNHEMSLTEEESKRMAFFSEDFLHGEIDLYLTAAGLDWGGYRNQYDFFKLLYDYLKLYEETQFDYQVENTSIQELYAMYLNQVQFAEALGGTLGREMVLDLGITSNVPGLEAENFTYEELCRWTLNNTNYIVENTEADAIPFHSILGLLSYRNLYCNISNAEDSSGPKYTGEMGYWPIGVWGADNQYAAQPINYAAVVNGGNAEIAVKVIKAMLDMEVAAQYGLSVNNEVCEKQLYKWENESDLFGGIRSIEFDGEGNYYESWTKYKTCWNSVIGGTSEWLEDKAEYSTQLREQIENIVIAEIPDSELISIWQNTLTETVESDISVEDGFELLCNRMDAWYEN